VLDRAGDACSLAPGIPLLLMNGDRVVRLRIDAVLDQKVHELIAMRRILRLNDVEMKHVPVTRADEGQIDPRGFSEARRVSLGPLDPIVVPLMNVLEFCAQDSRVDVVEAAVESEAMHVALVRSVIAELSHPSVDLGIVGDERPAVAEG